MITLRHLSLIASIAVLSCSAAVVTQAQTDVNATGTPMDTAATATTTPEGSESSESTITESQDDEVITQQGTRVSLQTRAQERIIQLAANVSNRFDATIRRFAHISTRLESRITKFEQAGMDTTGAKAALEQSRASLEQAQTLMFNIDATIYNAVTSESPRSAWPSVRTLLQDVHTELLTTQESLRGAIAALKDTTVQNNESLTASTTEETPTNGAASESTN